MTRRRQTVFLLVFVDRVFVVVVGHVWTSSSSSFFFVVVFVSRHQRLSSFHRFSLVTRGKRKKRGLKEQSKRLATSPKKREFRKRKKERASLVYL